MFLIGMHPDNDNKSYKRIRVRDLSKEARSLLSLRGYDIY